MNKRSGEIVQRAIRPQEVTSQVYEVWPAEFTAWMEQNGMPLPPQAQEQEVASGEPFAVSFPDDGDVYKIDPILRREFQTLVCTAVAPAHVRSMDWIIDDSVVASVARPFSFRWALAPGSHKLAVRVLDHGQERHSEAVTIHVY